MSNLHDLTEQLASSVVMADPEDLPAMAAIHDSLKAITQCLASEPGKAGVLLAATTISQHSTGLVERIILREERDLIVAMKDVNRQVADLQKLVDAAVTGGAMPTQSSSPAAGAATESPTSTVFGRAPIPSTSAVKAIPAESIINPDDLPLVKEFVAEANGHISTAEAEVLKVDENPDEMESINAIFRSFHTIKGVAGFLNLRQICALAHSAENLLDSARHLKLRLSGDLIDVVLEAIDLAKAMIGTLEAAAIGGFPPPIEPRLPAMLERLSQAVSGQLAAKSTAPAGAVTTLANPPVPASSSGTGDIAVAAHPTGQPIEIKNTAGKPGNNNGSDATVKVATDRLDALINMVGELVIAQAMVSQNVAAALVTNHRMGRNMAHLSKITRELQDLSMSMRMVPIQAVFQKMARLVRDLSHKMNKEVEFIVTGGETELDRNVVEAISDPLVHMVRNSLDHGVESPEDRQKAGKSRTGRVELKAFHQAGNIVIEIKDDGKGLNKARIIRKSVEAGIIREGQELSDQEIFKLIFHAGLSTAEKVTDVSGRGVGMDVVRRNVEALRGRIDIASVEGQGSTFSIRLPLTLAVIDGLVVKVGDERYIVPITSIEQSIRPKPEQLSSIHGRGELCMIRGTLLPLVRLHRLFNVPPKFESPTDALVVIVQNHEKRACLLVDELLGQQQVVIKSLGEGMAAVRGISGGAILGDGNVSLIIDVPGLMEVASGQ